MDEIQLKETMFYLETYGNHSAIISFYQSHNFLENAFHYLLDKVKFLNFISNFYFRKKRLKLKFLNK